jgi:hypothetical protein
MFAISTQDDETLPCGEPLQTVFGYALPIFTDADAGELFEGMIATSVQVPREPVIYASPSEAVIRGVPVRTRPTEAGAPLKLRAKDLIAELDAINAQIHKIMFQVERAVSRLATTG